MNRALIVCAAPAQGAGSYYKEIIAAADFVVAADAGTLLCLESDRVPDIVVGDLDSLPASNRLRAEELGARVLTAPTEKDETDLDLALDAVFATGYEHVTVTAAWSDRLDHTLAATGSVSRASGLMVDIADPDMAGWILDADVRSSVLLAGRGSTVSLLALTDTAVVSCTGTRYTLSHDTLDLLSSRGISNRITETTAEIRVHAGRLLVISHVVAGACLARFVKIPA